MIFDLEGANMEVFKGKNLKNFGFERAPNQICVKISVESAWSLQPTHLPHKRLECLSTKARLSGPVLFQKSILNHLSLKQNRSS